MPKYIEFYIALGYILIALIQDYFFYIHRIDELWVAAPSVMEFTLFIYGVGFMNLITYFPSRWFMLYILRRY